MIMETENLSEKLRRECWDKSYDCSAMKYIFEKRGQRLRFKINLLKAFGIIVPASVGITAISYGSDSAILKYAIISATALMAFQFIISVLAMVYKWDDELSYCYEAVQSYNPLYLKYHNLANLPPDNYQELRNQYDIINLESSYREQQDALHRVKEWEQRMGMRYSLRQHQCRCIGCNAVPLSMESTNCDVCGKFTFKYQNFIHKIIKS